MKTTVIEVNELRKHFRQGLARKRVEAVRGISFSVAEGQVFGFLGPNGAGKTTTIKVLTGLISPTSGSATLLGAPVPSPRVRARLGYLPENPYIYPYLTAREFVTHCGHLSGLGVRKARVQAAAVLERLGITYAADRTLRGLSKGMVQRSALAAALVSDPELLILDEPMSGLDPVGRRDVKELILEERRRGRTVFFSSHILSDVESLCDEVLILRKGKVVVSGKLQELLRTEQTVTELTLVDVSEALRSTLVAEEALTLTSLGTTHTVRVSGSSALRGLLSRVLAEGASVVKVTPVRETLEGLFVREAIGEGSQESDVSGRPG